MTADAAILLRMADEREAWPLIPPTIGSLFSGIDGLALGVQCATLGRVAWHAELDVACSSVLRRHWAAPNLGDLTLVDWASVEPVDILVGGFPCQDVSLAGKGAGIDGERSGLWRCYVAAIRALRPALVFVENVSALLARGFDRVLGDLAEGGYDAVWTSYSSAAVGAPHRRERVFILAADAARIGHDWCGERGQRAGGSEVVSGGAAADADSPGLRDAQQRQPGRRAHGVRDEGGTIALDDGKACASADSARAGLERPDERRAQQRELARRAAPSPDGNSDGREGLAPCGLGTGEPRGNDADGRGSSAGDISAGNPAMGAPRWKDRAVPGRRRLNPDFVEWMMGFPPGWTAGEMRRARLKMLGNSVQPQVARVVFEGLRARLVAP